MSADAGSISVERNLRADAILHDNNVFIITFNLLLKKKTQEEEEEEEEEECF